MRPSRSAVWFVVVGFVNTANYYVLYLVLHALGVEYLVAHFTATIIAMCGSYLLNCWLTFQVRPSWRTFVLFPLSSVANVVVTTVGLRVLVESVGMDERIAPLVAGVAAIPITYVVTRYLLVGRVPEAFTDEAGTVEG
jgi:putative flippase GtrA